MIKIFRLKTASRKTRNIRDFLIAVTIGIGSHKISILDVPKRFKNQRLLLSFYSNTGCSLPQQCVSVWGGWTVQSITQGYVVVCGLMGFLLLNIFFPYKGSELISKL